MHPRQECAGSHWSKTATEGGMRSAGLDFYQHLITLFQSWTCWPSFFVPGPSTSLSAGRSRRSTMYKTMWWNVGRRWSGIFFVLPTNYLLKLNCYLHKCDAVQGGGEVLSNFWTQYFCSICIPRWKRGASQTLLDTRQPQSARSGLERSAGWSSSLKTDYQW